MLVLLEVKVEVIIMIDVKKFMRLNEKKFIRINERVFIKVKMLKLRGMNEKGELLTDDPGVATGGWTTPGIVN